MNCPTYLHPTTTTATTSSARSATGISEAKLREPARCFRKTAQDARASSKKFSSGYTTAGARKFIIMSPGASEPFTSTGMAAALTEENLPQVYTTTSPRSPSIPSTLRNKTRSSKAGCTSSGKEVYREIGKYVYRERQ